MRSILRYGMIVHPLVTVIIAIYIIASQNEEESSFEGSRDAIITYHLIEERFWRLEHRLNGNIYVYRSLSSEFGPYFNVSKPTGWSPEEKSKLKGFAHSVLHLFEGTDVGSLVDVKVEYKRVSGERTVYRELNEHNTPGNLPNVAIVRFILGVDPNEGTIFKDNPIIPIELLRKKIDGREEGTEEIDTDNAIRLTE